MNRYLLNISYLGTTFRGAQKHFCKADLNQNDPNSIQGVLEIALKSLRPLNQPKVCLSSRTDAGVHALHSTCHVDLEFNTEHSLSPTDINVRLNTFLNRNNLEVRVLSVLQVNNQFHARFDAIRRTYLYRIAIRKSTTAPLKPALSFIPIEELRRCYFITTCSTDIDKIKEAANLFVGTHDFRSFMSATTNDNTINTRRNIEKIDIVPGEKWSHNQYPPNNLWRGVDYQYWNFICTSRSFLYRQIRRTVGVLLAVGQGKLTLRDVKFLLEIPSKNTWDPRAVTAPSYALYLCKVEYPDKCLIYKGPEAEEIFQNNNS